MTQRLFGIGKPASIARPLTVALILATILCLTVVPRSAKANTSSSQVYVYVYNNPISNLTASPISLTPTFSQSISDYALRCQAGTNTITLTLTAQKGSITVSGQSGSTVSVTVSVAENQAIVVQAPNPWNPYYSTQYWIRCLPHDFPQLQATGTGLSGWYLTGNINSSSDNTSGTYAMILDQNGTPVWYHTAPGGAFNLELLYNETLAWAPVLGPLGLGANPNGTYTLYNLKNGTTSSFASPIPPTDSHELLELPNGNRMMFSSPLKSNVDLSVLGSNFASANNTIVDCIVQEVDPYGNLVWQWDANNHVAIAESTLPALVNINGQTVADPYHCNSIDYNYNTNDLLVSMRNTSAVYLLPLQGNGQIIWKLAGNGAANPDNAKPISIVNDPEGTISGQHDARFESDGGISVYDDHTGLSGNSRGVEYTINTSTQTATFQVMFPSSGPAIALGSFRRYNYDRDNIVDWGLKPGSGFTEFDANGNQLFSVTFPNGELEYRTVKVPRQALNVELLHQTAGQ